MVMKQCPDCDQQVPVACKACYCGYEFFQRRVYQQAKPDPPSSETNKNRRTGRVKRERPDYYSASEFETQLRRLSNKTERCGSTSSLPKSPKKKHRGRPRKKGTLNKSSKTKVKGESSNADPKDNKEEDLYSNLSTENSFVYCVVLNEINRKLQSQWNGPADTKNTTVENKQYVFTEIDFDGFSTAEPNQFYIEQTQTLPILSQFIRLLMRWYQIIVDLAGFLKEEQSDKDGKVMVEFLNGRH